MFDASNSMNGTWKSGTKMLVAKKLLGNMLDSLKNKPDLELALRVYGHQKPFPPQDCDDTKLDNQNEDNIKIEISTTNFKVSSFCKKDMYFK